MGIPEVYEPIPDTNPKSEYNHPSITKGRPFQGLEIDLHITVYDSKFSIRRLFPL